MMSTTEFTSGGDWNFEWNSKSPKVTNEYPLETDNLTLYHVNTTTGSRWNRWIPAHDQFYDCAVRNVTGAGVGVNPNDETRRRPVNFSSHENYLMSQEGEDKYVYQHFFRDDENDSQRPRYFIEIGALNGKDLSNSYFFDVQLGWGGLLIEGETTSYVQLENNRGPTLPRPKQQAQNITVTTAHLSICQQAQFLHMTGAGAEAKAGITGGNRRIGFRKTTVPCVPMRTVVQMAKVPHVDFYSIDVEGAELAVIQTHDFHAVPARVVLVEMRPADENLDDLKNARVRRALYARGFCRYHNSVGHNNEVWINETWVEPAMPNGNDEKGEN